MTLGPGACADSTPRTTFLVSNNEGVNFTTPCSTYQHGQQNGIRCDYDDRACQVCACECAHASCPAFVCGDGVVNGDEECDLGQQELAADVETPDGCSNDCKVQCGWMCPQHCQGDWWECDPVYQRSGVQLSAIHGMCSEIAVCGDGQVASSEGCDDGNRDMGDGCDENCQLETNYLNKGQLYDCENIAHNNTCAGSITVCTTRCGDSIRSPVEECDDGNKVNVVLSRRAGNVDHSGQLPAYVKELCVAMVPEKEEKSVTTQTY